MKRIIAVVLIVCSIVSFALADTDLSSMSFNELISLNHQITAEIMSRPEWKSVVVPAGQWLIGQDIPEGYYSVRKANEKSAAIISAQEQGSIIEDFYYVIGKDKYIGKVFFRSGCVFKTSSDVILEPPKGLGF